MATTDTLRKYAAHTALLARNQTTAEETYYPAIREMMVDILKSQRLPYDVRVNTIERRGSRGLDRPDVALYDTSGEFALVCVEVKTPRDEVEDVAMSEDRNDQIGRYLAQTKVVVVTNVRSFALVTAIGWEGEGAVPPSARRIEEVVNLWPSTAALIAGEMPASETLLQLTDLLVQAVTAFAPLSDPESLARVLAQQARRAKAAMPMDFTYAVAGLQHDFGEALGITFEGEEGEEFFRSSLIQTVFYGIFAGWTLWQRAGASESFDWRDVPNYLRIPFLGDLFYDINQPTRLKELNIRDYLDVAARTLTRVDVARFFAKMIPPTLDGNAEVEAVNAITYFYEPFLEAFDPELRKSLGVWYTPPEIVRYQVQKVHALLRDELKIPLGLADDSVVILDPCCGTGAYLIEALQTIATTLREEGVGIELGERLRYALSQRVIGFEILTAPFVIAHLQLYLLLTAMNAAPGEGERLAVFLTNALTGWGGGGDQLKLNFPELQREREAAQRVKRTAKVIVVIGNPPYNRFSGAALSEEAALVDHYKGIKRNAKGKQIGQSELFTKWGVRKHLLDDLYVRFFRLAEEQIGKKAEYGIVSFISNNRYLTGRSFPIMRESLLHSFQDIWVDNLHGYRQASERTPWGTTCETTFAMEASSGIKVGTAIVTYLKRRQRTSNAATLHVRNFHGRALAKRRALLLSLQVSPSSKIHLAGEDRVSQDFGIPVYESFESDATKRWKMVPYDAAGGYEDWPALDEIFVEKFQGVNHNRGIDGSLIDVDRDALVARMKDYFSDLSWSELSRRYPQLCTNRAEYNAEDVRDLLRNTDRFDDEQVVPYLLTPLDARFIYYGTKFNLLNRRRPELWENLPENEFFVLQPEPRRVTAGRPLLARCLYDLHVHEGGSVGFSAFATPNAEQASLFDGNPGARATANFSPALWEALSSSYGLSGDLTGKDALTLAKKLMRAALALAHAPKFESEHRESLAQDWMHLPLPKDTESFERLAEAGERIAVLLDPQVAPRPVLREILGEAYVSLAKVSQVGAPGPIDFRVMYSYGGASQGRWIPTAPQTDVTIVEASAQSEGWRPEWGTVTGELYLNPSTYLANVPDRVWRYELGGYPVVKKWLGYRQANRRDGKSLTPAELECLRVIIHRIAALLAMHPHLDDLYEKAVENPFTIEELGLR